MALEGKVVEAFKRWLGSCAGQVCAECATLADAPAPRTELARRLGDAFRAGVVFGEQHTKGQVLDILDRYDHLRSAPKQPHQRRSSDRRPEGGANG